MSRGRPAGSRGPAPKPDNEQVMTQVWHGLVDTLRLLPTIPNDDRAGDPSHVPAKITLDDALDKISVLIALRRGEPIAPETLGALTPAVSTPGSSGGLMKRKRRPSVSASPAPAATQAPTTGGSNESALTSVASPLYRSGTPGTRDGMGTQRKELYLDQLPLQPGRKVAFKIPVAKHGKEKGGEDEGGENEWILATIQRCILQDKMRYEVQDADDPTKQWGTTLGSIIPLPDPTSAPHLSSHPSNLEDYPKGSIVLGLYPDTTAFYRATVLSAPIPGTGMGLGVRGGNGKPEPGAKREKYRLSFVDDGDNVNEVHKDYVVMASPPDRSDSVSELKQKQFPS